MAAVLAAVYGRRAVVHPARWLTIRKKVVLHKSRPNGLAVWIVERWVLVFTVLVVAVVLAWVLTSVWVTRSSVAP